MSTKGDVVFWTSWLAGGLVGAAIGYGISADIEDSTEQFPTQLEELQEEQVALDFERDTIASDVGESCMRLVSVYLPGGDLQERDEDTVVDDLLREPGLPCGDSATEIRTDISNLKAIEAELAEVQNQSDNLKDDEDEGVNPGHVMLGGVGGVLVVLFPAAFAGVCVEDWEKKRKHSK